MFRQGRVEGLRVDVIALEVGSGRKCPMYAMYRYADEVRRRKDNVSFIEVTWTRFRREYGTVLRRKRLQDAMSMISFREMEVVGTFSSVQGVYIMELGGKYAMYGKVRMDETHFCLLFPLSTPKQALMRPSQRAIVAPKVIQTYASTRYQLSDIN